VEFEPKMNNLLRRDSRKGMTEDISPRNNK